MKVKVSYRGTQASSSDDSHGTSPLWPNDQTHLPAERESRGIVVCYARWIRCRACSAAPDLSLSNLPPLSSRDPSISEETVRAGDTRCQAAPGATRRWCRWGG